MARSHKARKLPAPLPALGLGLAPAQRDTAREIGHLPRGTGVLGTISRKGESVRTDQVSEHPDAVGFPPGHPSMETFLGVPVRIGDRIFGNLYLADKPGGFSSDDELAVEFLAVAIMFLRPIRFAAAPFARDLMR